MERERGRPPALRPTPTPELAAAWVAKIARDFTDHSMPLEVQRLGRTIGEWAAQIVAWHQAHVSKGPPKRSTTSSNASNEQRSAFTVSTTTEPEPGSRPAGPTGTYSTPSTPTLKRGEPTSATTGKNSTPDDIRWEPSVLVARFLCYVARQSRRCSEHRTTFDSPVHSTNNGGFQNVEATSNQRSSSFHPCGWRFDASGGISKQLQLWEVLSLVRHELRGQPGTAVLAEYQHRH